MSSLSGWVLAATVLLLCHKHCVLGSHRVARNPVVLDLRSALNGTVVRSKPMLFESALNLRSNEDFCFHNDKWEAIKQSGLYANLTSSVIVDDEGNLQLKVSGHELPVRVVAPELSVATAHGRPQVAGGLYFSDKNFRGLGEQLEANCGHQQIIHSAGILDAAPLLKLHWKDNAVGKSGSVEVLASSELMRHSAVNWGKLAAGHLPHEEIGMRLSKLHVMFKTVWGRTLLSMDHYISDVSTSNVTVGRALWSGSKLTLKRDTKLGNIDLWINNGESKVSHANISEAQPTQFPFSSMGGIFTSNTNRFSVAKFSPRFVVRLPFFRSKGDGLLPFEHLQMKSSPYWIRCIGKQSSETHSVASAAAVKVDLYSKDIGGVTPGLFVDSGFLHKIGSPVMEYRTTLGLSFRALGFRVDFGVPVDNFEHPLFHVGVDRGD